jgi:hypothetical protein
MQDIGYENSQMKIKRDIQKNRNIGNYSDSIGDLSNSK